MIKSCKPHKQPLLVAAISMAAMNPAQALDFYSGGIEGSLTSQISIGSTWRMEEAADFITTGKPNSNDGDANYDKGDVVSQIFKGSHDLQMDYENVGAFIRGKYWHDFALSDNDVNAGQTSNGFVPSTSALDDSNNNELSKFSGAVLLDAFVYGEFDVADIPLDVRLGKQVLSWGESTFIMGGINAINPFDVASFRRPGATLKEGLIPINMAYANLGLSDSLNLEAFYLLEYQETVLEGCGTFFSTTDYVAEGCNGVLTPAGTVLRVDDDKPSASGQFGVAMRYVSEALGDTEFGFYAMNIHSRSPMVSMLVDAGSLATPGDESHNYRVVYPEDQQLAAVSFATTVGTMALSGEVTHKKDVPLQIKDSLLITSALANNVTALSAFYPGTVGSLGALGSSELDAQVTAAYDASVVSGSPVEVAGYQRHDISQAQVTAIKLIDQLGPIDRIALIGEVGYTFVHDLAQGDDVIRYDTSVDNITEGSWGYRTRIVSQFNNVFAGVNLTPTISWKKDVKGYSPNPGGNFREGRETLGLKLKADYLSTYSAALSYTRYGAGENNKITDRDFASITVGMSF